MSTLAGNYFVSILQRDSAQIKSGKPIDTKTAAKYHDFRFVAKASYLIRYKPLSNKQPHEKGETHD